jgi:hypothetical protein
MAKIKARGAYELARVCRETQVNDPAESITWKRWTRLLRSDGVILEKYQVRYRPEFTSDPPTGRLHDWGWHKAGKLNPEIRAALKTDPQGIAARWKQNWLARGYEEC